MTTFSAIVFTVFIVIVIMFQFALAVGMPWGSAAMGGKFPGKYPPAMRIACLIQIVILVLIAVIVLTRAELLLSDWYPLSTKAIWFVVAFSAVATFLNLITESKWERRIWAPVSLTLLVLSLIVAFG